MNQNTQSFRPQPLRVGSLSIDPPLVLAPMAGVTDNLYRSIMAEHGAGLVMTEMVSIQGLVRGQPATWALCAQEPPVKVPVGVQIFGHDPLIMAEAAQRLEASGVALIDINAGCPVKKVVKQGAGASLLREPDHLAFIVEEVKRAVSIPVTVKVRLGWDDRSVTVVETARRLASAGADAMAVHARTAMQFYGGRSDWSWIRRVKAAVDIPVIGNGDITSPELADAMLRQTGCDAVMIGRATQGNPWLLSVIASQWGQPGAGNGSAGWNDYRRTVDAHIEGFRIKKPKGVGHLRQILLWYSKGCPDSARLRSRLSELNEAEAMRYAFFRWVQELEDRGVPFLHTKVPHTGGSWRDSSSRNEGILN